MTSPFESGCVINRFYRVRRASHAVGVEEFRRDDL